MAHQQDIEGWPLGLLQPLNNARVIELARSGNNSGSISFNTLVTCSSTDNNSSSDLDTESTGSFYVDNSTTLGSLMGVSTISELSRRAPNNKTEQDLNKIKKQNNNRFSFMISRLLCPSSSSRTRNTKNNNNNNNSNNDGPSLGEYLAVERTSNKPIIYYGPDDEIAMAETIHIAEPNSLFVNGTIAPPQTNNNNNNNNKKRFRSSLSELFSCVCGPSLA